MSTTHRQRALTLITATVLVAVAACSSGADASSSKSSASSTTTSQKSTQGVAVSGTPLKIGLISQEDETVAFPEASASARAAVAYLNAEKGGIGGRPVELVVCTTGDSAESAVACANQFANDDSVPLVLDQTYNSVAVNDVLVGRKAILTWNLDLSDITTPGLFAIDPGVYIPAQVMANIAKSEGAKTVAVLYTEETKDFMLPAFETALNSAGLTVAQSVPVTTGGDYSAPVAAAEVNDVDLVMMLLVDSAQCAGVGKILTEQVVTTPVVSVDVCSDVATVETGNVNGWRFAITNTGTLDPSSGDPGAVEFRRIIDTYAEGEPYYGTIGAFTLAATLAAADIYAKVGVDNVTPEAINKLLSAGWSYTPLTYVPLKCPGAAPFIGLCVDSMWDAKAVDGKLVLASPVPVPADMSVFADLGKK